MTSAAARAADVSAHDTLPKVLRHNAKHFGGETALREKEFGIWNAYSWTHYARHVEHLALALADEGVAAGDVVALAGGGGRYWLYGALAAQSCGAISFGICGDAAGGETRDLLVRAGATIVIAENEEQTDKLLELGGAIPRARRIIYADPRGMRKYADPRLLSLSDALVRGERLAAADPRRFYEMTDAGDGGQTAMLCATSGAGGAPKLAEISHGAFLRHVAEYLRRDPQTAADDYVSALPPPWIMETLHSLGKSLVCRMKINFVESAATLSDDLREIGPTALILVPREWERIAADVRAQMEDSTAFKRAIFRRGLSAGLAAAKSGGRSRAADFFVFRALRDALGFSRLTSAAAAGAALGADVCQFFLALGVPLRQSYGQTELLGAYSIHSAGDIDVESCGRPFAGVEVKIANPDDAGIGGIVARNPNMMRGYYRDAEETAKVVRGGWMDTGDAGCFGGGGHLIVIGRREDLSRAADGALFSPSRLENKLKFSPHIGDAVVFGGGREFLAALVCVRADSAAKWAQRRRIAFTSYADLSSRREVRALIKAEIAAINAAQPPSQRLRKFVILRKELDAADGELTRAGEPRRAAIAARYKDVIDAIYAEDGAANLGRGDGIGKAALHIEDLSGE